MQTGVSTNTGIQVSNTDGASAPFFYLRQGMAPKKRIRFAKNCHLTIFEKSFGTNLSSTVIYHGNYFDSSKIPIQVYRQIAILLKDAYNQGAIDKQQEIAEKIKAVTDLTKNI